MHEKIKKPQAWKGRQDTSASILEIRFWLLDSAAYAI